MKAVFPFRLAGWFGMRGIQQTGNTQQSESRDRNLLREETGGSMIEMVLSSTVMLAILLCMVQVCLVLYAYCCTAMAAREGTRYAIVRGSACSSFATACPATVANVQSYVQGLRFPAVNAAAFGVTPTYSATPSGSSCSPCNSPGDQVKIQVTYSYPIALPMVSKMTLSLSSTSQMTISQ
jgi:hypothetical protein